jgi:acetyltransferase-like isoleucine patch superfamily enzyme
MKKVIIQCIWFIGKLWSLFYTYSSSNRLSALHNKLYTAWLSREFKTISKFSTILYPIDLLGGKYISIGDGCAIGKRSVLTAWDKRGSQTFMPQIHIGNNVSIGDDSHITAINRIEIGNYVLIGKKITITDNAHGKSDYELLSLPPSVRPLYSEGPVIIEDGVWIGDKVTILPNVRIGKNAIIGANAVVTRDIPANSVAGGIPTKVIKTLD